MGYPVILMLAPAVQRSHTIGCLGHDPKKVFLKFFDAFFYTANWGSLCLMLRFPKGLIDEADIGPYCVEEYVSFESIGDYQVLDLNFSPEDSG